jgi:hypothetical protein
MHKKEKVIQNLQKLSNIKESSKTLFTYFMRSLFKNDEESALDILTDIEDKDKALYIEIKK